MPNEALPGDYFLQCSPQRQSKFIVSGKMQLLHKKIGGNSSAPNRLTGQKQLLKRNEAVFVT